MTHSVHLYSFEEAVADYQDIAGLRDAFMQIRRYIKYVNLNQALSHTPTVCVDVQGAVWFKT